MPWGQVLEIKRALEAAATDPDQDKFFQALENSEDGFSVVAEHFGRGLLGSGGKREDS